MNTTYSYFVKRLRISVTCNNVAAVSGGKQSAFVVDLDLSRDCFLLRA